MTYYAYKVADIQTCHECGKEFDLFDKDQAAEFYYGHDCEEVE